MYIYILFFCIADIKKGNYLNGTGGRLEDIQWLPVVFFEHDNK